MIADYDCPDASSKTQHMSYDRRCPNSPGLHDFMRDSIIIAVLGVVILSHLQPDMRKDRWTLRAAIHLFRPGVLKTM